MHPPFLIFLLLVVSTLTLALILLLWIPFVCRFELKRDSDRDPVQRIEVRWLFLSRVIDDFAATGREDRRREKADAKMDVMRIFELFRTLHRPVTALAQRVVQRIDFRELSCRATFGLDDPADTGMLSGFLYAAFAPLICSPAVSVRLHPVFHEPAFACRVRGSLRVTVGRMIIPAIRFLCDRAVRGVIVRRVRGWYIPRVQPGRGARKRLPGSC
uniref:DUF2953 domain-containing protein n=1 Tax=Candidatus Methanogaster sp. ANME-2c ERB4 TaxID=2759911 RepID=A0A7G9YFH2_9EURY|nr:hypothetical protein DEIDBPHB_00005 [Methanosarcinales archaeon ANME-2c ERB4]